MRLLLVVAMVLGLAGCALIPEGDGPPPALRLNPDGTVTPMIDLDDGLYINPATGNIMISPMPGVLINPNRPGPAFPMIVP
jgi:hypothetical protein